MRDPDHVWTTQYGFRMLAPRSTDWGYVTTRYEPELCRAILDVLSPDDVAVDAGANIGYFTLLMGQVAQRVIAVEPDDANVAILTRNLALNDGRYEVVAAAASDREGIGFLAEGPSPLEHRLASRGRQVRLCRLDSIAPEATLVKIDVEGAELEAVTGLGALLDRTTILLELHGEAGQRALDLLVNRGHTCVRIADAHVLCRPGIASP